MPICKTATDASLWYLWDKSLHCNIPYFYGMLYSPKMWNFKNFLCACVNSKK
jgi:hypothetical protein